MEWTRRRLDASESAMDARERELIEAMMMVDVPIVWESDENDTPQEVAAFLARRTM